MVRQTDGWDALPYAWDGDDAYLSLTGAIRPMTLSSGEPFNYLVPSKNQCASCHATNHTTGELMPIGIEHSETLLNKNQPSRRAWLARRCLAHQSANAVWEDKSQSLEHLAAVIWHQLRHCHSAQGPRTRRACLDYQDHRRAPWAGANRPSRPEGFNGHLYGIVPGHADDSILAFA